MFPTIILLGSNPASLGVRHLTDASSRQLHFVLDIARSTDLPVLSHSVAEQLSYVCLLTFELIYIDSTREWAKRRLCCSVTKYNYRKSFIHEVRINTIYELEQLFSD